ncbi:MAG: hypothetical protein ABSG15_02305 [FCB group bacterium]
MVIINSFVNGTPLYFIVSLTAPLYSPKADIIELVSLTPDLGIY